jgi:outer membrane protein OmpA-like peptidoglycan-associated protein
MENHRHGSGLDTSLTDLMTSLAVIFILLLVASLNNAQQEGASTVSRILQQLQSRLKSFEREGVIVQKDPADPLSLMVLVPEDLLGFQLNDSQVPAKGIAFLKEFTPDLFQTVCSDEFRNDVTSIIIEGHTDSTGTEAINLPLSQRRSMEVVMHSLADLPVADDDSPALLTAPGNLRACVIKLLSATGRGSAEPILTSGREDRERSRRVVFKIRVRSLEQKDLVEVLRGRSTDR